MIDQLLKPSIQSFIRDHENDDVFTLTLKHQTIDNVPFTLVAEQLSGRQKAKQKLPSWYQKEGIIYPSKLSMEQCSSEETANYKASLIKGKSFIDLTGGFGVDTLALSRKFKKGTYIEQQYELAEIVKHNLHILDVSNVEVYADNGLKIIKDLDPVDIIYVDPARRDDQNKKVFFIQDCNPNMIEILPVLLQKAKQVMIKTSPMLDINQTLKDLKTVRAVYIIAVNNECKEVLYIVDRQSHVSLVHAVNLNKTENEVFSFTHDQEANANAPLSEPLNFLYEPNSALLKAGVFNLISEEFGLYKLNPNTHLYTSKRFVPDFPGRKFNVVNTYAYNSGELKKIFKNKKANITTRNFPDSIAQIKKKLRLKDGGEDYLFACQNKSQKPMIIHCIKAS